MVERDALADAQRAMRLIRLHASEWHIDPARTGVLGMSAGGHLALNLATHSDAGDPAASNPLLRLSCRPAFLCLLCPWPDRQTIESFPIDSGSPPAFIATALDDTVAPSAFAASIVDAMGKRGVQAGSVLTF
jgi:acetyl esterase/lipase